MPTEFDNSLKEILSSDHTGRARNHGCPSEDSDEVYTGLRAQDLQEAKDQLVVETADMLHIPLFTAEALLRDNGIGCSIFLINRY